MSVVSCDLAVNIESREVVVYPDDLPDPKPAVGEELNKQAVIQMHGYWPKDKTTGDLIRDQQRLDRMNYATKLQGLVTKIEGTFLQYKPETGTCIFKVSYEIEICMQIYDLFINFVGGHSNVNS